MVRFEIQKTLYFPPKAFLLLLFTTLFVNAQSNSIVSKEWQEDSVCKIPVKIAHTSDKAKARHIYLLLDSQYFSKISLKKLFKCFSERNRDAISLDITAFSDLNNLRLAVKNYLEPLPDENPPFDTSEQDCKDLTKALSPCPTGYHRAFYSRFDKEYFLYNPSVASQKLVRINL